MNSRSGISTPVDSMSTVTAMPGFGRLRNSRMRCSGRSTRPGDLLDERLPPAKYVSAGGNELIRMRQLG